MIDKVIFILMFLVMLVVLAVSLPIALVSVAWEFGKDVYHGRKPKIWGIG